MRNPTQKYTLIAPNGIEQNMLLTEDHLRILQGQGFTLKPEPVVRQAIIKTKLVKKAAVAEAAEEPAAEEPAAEE